MRTLSKHTDRFDHIQGIVSPVLRHFDRATLKKELIHDIARAAHPAGDRARTRYK